MTQDQARQAFIVMAAPWLWLPAQSPSLVPRLSDHIVGAGNQQEAEEET